MLRRGGRLVTLSAPPPAGMTAMFFIVTPNRDQLAELAALVDSGRRPNRRPGKTVLVVS